MIPEGEADFLVAFEKLEALRYRSHLAPGGTALINDQRITPSIEALKHAPYPDDEEMLAALGRRAATVRIIPGLEVALALGNPRLANVVLLGALSTHLALTEHAWRQALTELVPPTTVDLNLRAFYEGRAPTEGHAGQEQRGD